MAYKTVFQKILADGVKAGKVPAKTQEARKWFRQQARSTKTNASAFVRESRDRLTDKASVGEMFLFFYDPKHKKTLPYFDSFPLIFKIEEYNDRFLGINLHYLQPTLRAKLMDALYETATNQRYDEKTKLRISYGILKGAAKFKYFRPCIKMYLKSHVRSRFVKVNAHEWDIALMLGVASWNKAKATTVWKDSREKMS